MHLKLLKVKLNSLVGFGLQKAYKNQTDTVQHILHSSDIKVNYTIDKSVIESCRLSDHPFLKIEVTKEA